MVVLLFCVVVSSPGRVPEFFSFIYSCPKSAPSQYRDAGGQPLPFRQEEELLDFLRIGRVTVLGKVGEGITGARKVLVQKDGLRVHAIFRDVRVAQLSGSGQNPMRLRDDCIFECAAYELNRLLGLDLVPPVVERKVLGTLGTLQVWIEGAETEKRRKKRGSPARDKVSLARQGQIILIFDNLIFNDDRNSGNILHGPDGKVWMIDHTRSFRTDEELPYPGGVESCETTLWRRLRSLKLSELRKTLRPYLRPAEVQALIERKRKLVELLQDIIDQKGEEVALFTVN